MVNHPNRSKKLRYELDEKGHVVPDEQSIEVANRSRPDLLERANRGDIGAAAELWRLAQATQLKRCYEQGLLPAELMREFPRSKKPDSD